MVLLLHTSPLSPDRVLPHLILAVWRPPDRDDPGAPTANSRLVAEVAWPRQLHFVLILNL